MWHGGDLGHQSIAEPLRSAVCGVSEHGDHNVRAGWVSIDRHVVEPELKIRAGLDETLESLFRLLGILGELRLGEEERLAPHAVHAGQVVKLRAPPAAVLVKH